MVVAEFLCEDLEVSMNVSSVGSHERHIQARETVPSAMIPVLILKID